MEPPPETRRRILGSLLASLDSTFLVTTSPDPASLAPLASLLKFLGRSPAGSEELGRVDALRTLLLLGGLARAAELPSAAPSSPPRDAEDSEEDLNKGVEAYEQDPLQPYESEALRCLCNVLTLHPAARDIFPEVLASEPERLALKGMVRLLACQGAGFLAGRLLFLLTSKSGELISELTEKEATVEALELVGRSFALVFDPS